MDQNGIRLNGGLKMRKFTILLFLLIIVFVIGCQNGENGDKKNDPTATPAASTPTPEPDPTEEPTPEPTPEPTEGPKGVNVALDKPYEVSSYTINERRGWNPDFINDGEIECIDGYHYGWTSQVGKYVDVDPTEAEEWVIIDLEKEYNITTVIAWPRQDTGLYFPTDYKIDVSNDKENWTTVYEKKGDDGSSENDLSPRIIKLEDVKGRFVRFVGTQLRDDDQTYNNGLLMQLAELEIYSEDN